MEQPTSIAARIAALNLGQVNVGQSQSRPSSKSARPPPPDPPSRRPALPSRTQTSKSLVTGGASHIGNEPAAPEPRVESNQVVSMREVTTVPDDSSARRPPPPSLPPRPSRSGQPSNPSLPTRPSSDRTNSQASLTPAVYDRIRAPKFDAATLPPLPRRTKDDVRPVLAESRSSSSSGADAFPKTSSPQLPKRISDTPSTTPKRSALNMGFDSSKTPPVVPTSRPASTTISTTPPPVPKSSKPKSAASYTQSPAAAQQMTASSEPTVQSCLHCRDFSAPDHHATRFPRQSIPSTDLGWLAQQLVAPFTSLTDRARVIFLWLHHNIDYDTQALYNNCVKASTPASTLSTGMAVCEGYAGLFNAIALKAGLESIVVGGHGKGVGYAAVTAGSPLPAYDGNHAWNAVRIDDGRWKLIDACWGAGQVGGWGQPYKRNFAPENFCADNTDFGISHYPSDGLKQFREDGRVLSWEQYMLSDTQSGPFKYGGYIEQEGVARSSFQPDRLAISLGGSATEPRVRFQFNRICQHWDPVRNGKGQPYCFVLLTHADSDAQKLVPFEHNGYYWWADVSRGEIGRPGGTIKLAVITSLNGGNARGLTAAEFREKEGRCGLGWGYVCHWDIVA